MLTAVYGTLRDTCSNNGLLGSSKYIGRFETDPEYKMVDLGAYPGIMPGGTTPILMEVYEIDEPTLKRVDQLEGYNAADSEHTFYERVAIPTPYGDAFTYIYKAGSDGAAVINSGDWVDHAKLKRIAQYV